MSVAIVTDSNSGITQKQSKEFGVFVVPMPFMVDGHTYNEDIDLSHKAFYENLKEGADISTSQPSPGTLIEAWNILLEDFQELVYIPMSSSLSSSYATARMLSEDYDGRVEVVDNRRISLTQRQSVLDAKALADRGLGACAIKDALLDERMDSSIYITVDTLEYLKKGGRITPAAALLGTFLKIKPVLTIQGGKLDAFAKARTMKQARAMMVAAMKNDLENRFQDPKCRRTHMAVAHAGNEESALEFKQELEGIFPGLDIFVDSLSLSVACHTGPGALGYACSRSLDVLEGERPHVSDEETGF